MSQAGSVPPLPVPPLDGSTLRERLARHGLPFTEQRRQIWEALEGHTGHPSADAIFDAVEPRLPGLSRATVYRTLETFVQVGAVTRIGHPGATVRYDPKTRRHHHLICEECGAVIDVESDALDAISPPDTLPKGFIVRDFSVLYSGRCGACAPD